VKFMKKLHKIGFSKLTSVKDAYNRLIESIEGNPSEEIPSKDCLNHVLASDVKSEMNIPPFDRSAMDGYAILAEDSFGASPSNPKTVKKVGTSEIGEICTEKVKKGEAIRISTGAIVPEGADAVIRIEETEIEEDVVTLLGSIPPGKNIAEKGEDVKEGEIILKAGTQIKAEQLALISSLGIETIKVTVPPKIAIFATGNELLEVGETYEGNKIYNSNTPMIVSLSKTYGALIQNQGTLPDDKETLKKYIKESSQTCQILVFTGGTSVGTKDFLPEVVEELGQIQTHGIAMRPGSPILIGSYQKCLIFCLPGTPVAAYVGFLQFVGPAIRKMLNCTQLDPRRSIPATITDDVPLSGMGYIHFLRVIIKEVENELHAIPYKLKGSGILTSLTEADGIVEISPIQEGLKRGEKVWVKLFPW